MAWMAAVQTGFGFVAAILLGGLGLVRLGLMPEPEWLAAASPNRIPGIGRWLRTAASKGRGLGMVATGAVMGLLPCGLSFAAFARALGAAHPLAGAGLTLAFGLGTLPGLLLLGTGLAPLARRYRRASDLLAGLLMVVMALQLVVQTLAAFAS
jgi:sulfite exporter TauE/SafE